MLHYIQVQCDWSDSSTTHRHAAYCTSVFPPEILGKADLKLIQYI